MRIFTDIIWVADKQLRGSATANAVLPLEWNVNHAVYRKYTKSQYQQTPRRKCIQPQKGDYTSMVGSSQRAEIMHMQARGPGRY